MQIKSKIGFLAGQFYTSKNTNLSTWDNLRHPPAKQPDNPKDIALGEGKHL